MEICCLERKELVDGESCLVYYTSGLNVECLSEKHSDGWSGKKEEG